MEKGGLQQRKRRDYGASKESAKRPKGKRTLRKEEQEAAELEEEHRLTNLLFGNANAPTATRQIIPSEPAKEEQEEETELFAIDRTGDSVPAFDTDQVDDTNEDDEEVDNEDDEVDIEDDQDDNDGPAWVDDDDGELEVNLLDTSRLKKLRKSRAEEAASALSGTDLEERLRQRYRNTAQAAARTDWAKLDQKEDDKEEDDDEEEDDFGLQSSSAPLLLQSSSGQKLAPNILNVMRCPDANQADPSQSVVQVVNFHPSSNPDRPLLLTGGLDKTLRFFQVGAEESEKVHGVHFPKLPIYSASFLGSTGNVVVSGRRPFFYIYDTVAGKADLVPRIIGRDEKSLEKCVGSPDGKTIAFCGNDGYVLLFDTRSKRSAGELKMNGSVRAMTFSPDSNHILGSGSDGDVYRWDLRSRKCLERFSNEDGTISSALAASSRDLAVGAESGVVNLFSDAGTERTAKANRTPTKSIMNLHTSADMVRFNPDGQILAMSSRREKNALKLLHVPTATVFSNWPTSKTPLNYVWSVDFSPESRFMAIGNDKGKCLLYRMMHYTD